MAAGGNFSATTASTSSACRTAATGYATRCAPISCKSRSGRRGNSCARSAQVIPSRKKNARFLPTNYKSRPDAFDNFADRVSTSAPLRRYNVNHLYRAHLAAEQMIAENIVRFMHDNPTMKLLVFLPDDVMINPREVADYVAQKASLQQMILDRSQALPSARPPLLAQPAGPPAQGRKLCPKSLSQRPPPSRARAANLRHRRVLPPCPRRDSAHARLARVPANPALRASALGVVARSARNRNPGSRDGRHNRARLCGRS